MADVVKGFRDAIQDLLLPEFRGMREQIAKNAAAIAEQTRAMDERFEKLRLEMDERFLRVDERFARLEAAHGETQGELRHINRALERIFSKLDIAERVVKLETKMDMVAQKVGV